MTNNKLAKVTKLAVFSNILCSDYKISRYQHILFMTFCQGEFMSSNLAIYPTSYLFKYLATCFQISNAMHTAHLLIFSTKMSWSGTYITLVELYIKHKCNIITQEEILSKWHTGLMSCPTLFFINFIDKIVCSTTKNIRLFYMCLMN